MASVVAGAILVPSAHAAPAQRTVARADSTSVTLGSSVVVKVLANDTTTGARSKAQIKVISTSWRLKVAVTKSRTIRVTPKASTKPGRYTLRYRVISKGRWATAKVTVRVKAKPVPRPIDAAPTPAPVPSPVPSPVPDDSLATVLSTLTVAPEVSTGYDRDEWKHWNVGAIPDDGCDTRSEILIAEAVVPVAPGTKCAITKSNSGGGSWFSYYDDVTTTNPTAMDVDHMVPLAEAHHSGGWAWDAATREAYANDQGDARSLVAVSASSNRSKSDRDPAEWLPTLQRCRYASEWVAVKARWQLAVDEAEKAALAGLARTECATTTVVVITR